ncbi:hypothetical protein POM88_011270 [Heracleum sosnowskyi]|uniref:F-box associated beta-propeller type 1 domain-containing protein n=1 Tax=Heracleum sosnowskyi TaxID=360622 RepID=A0AAD8IU67_9APIA|nr:hypothetical protein POM88_011270 [Heracleum sosnowskyi]
MQRSINCRPDGCIVCDGANSSYCLEDVDFGCITVVEVSEPLKTFLSGSGLFGFGYDNVNDDYKVMAATDMVVVANGNSFTYVVVAVYSLKGNSWTMDETIEDRYEIVRHVSKYANGSLYWIAYKDDTDIIVAFDLGVETHRELPFPDYVSAYDDGNDVHLTVGNNHLCLFNLFPCSHTDIWFMNDTGVGNSLSKMIFIGQPSMFGNFESVWPYGFSKNLNGILFGKELKKVSVHGVPIGSILLAYTESLVQPLESKPIESKAASDESGYKRGEIEVNVVREDLPVDVMVVDTFPDEKVENKNVSIVASMKRKAHGKVTNFWMDHFKSHCYVSVSPLEEAVETRNVVYNLQWPEYGGRLLVLSNQLFLFPCNHIPRRHVHVQRQAPQTPVSLPPPATTAAPVSNPAAAKERALPPPPLLGSLPL